MQLLRYLPETATSNSAVAIGNFDGLHTGHQALITQMHAAAQRLRVVPTVLTFAPHPRQFFAPKSGVFQLVRLNDKLHDLRGFGVEQVAMPRFNAAFAAMEPEAFLDHLLLCQLGARAVITGEDFTFGRARRGDVAMLSAWGKKHGVEVITVPQVMVEGEVCSSSAIRTAITHGEIKKANRMLGRDYRLRGCVVHGDGRGQMIGFPTANIALMPDILLPKNGVYAVRVMALGVVWHGVANLGVRPTVAVDNRPRLEVHLFDVMQDFYGKKLTVRFVDRLRDEMKFDGVDALVAQIRKDCDIARALVTHEVVDG